MCKLHLLALIVGALTIVHTNGGVVTPVTPCGGYGRILELRVTDCTVPPCQLVPGETYLIEADFIPYYTCDALAFQLLVTYNRTVFIWASAPIPGSAVVGGEEYTIQYPLIPDDALRGETVYVRTIVSCVPTGVQELCAGAYATIV